MRLPPDNCPFIYYSTFRTDKHGAEASSPGDTNRTTCVVVQLSNPRKGAVFIGSCENSPDGGYFHAF